MTSFPMFFRDFSYTLCFFTKLVHKGDDYKVSDCTGAITFRVFDILFIFFGIFYRCI